MLRLPSAAFRLKANQLPKLVLGVTFNNGIEVITKQTDRQPETAAA
jgi:putative transposase